VSKAKKKVGSKTTKEESPATLNEPNADMNVKPFYRIERVSGGWQMLTCFISESGKIMSVLEGELDILNHVIDQFEKSVRGEHGV
jgi:hypothetical protein